MTDANCTLVTKKCTKCGEDKPASLFYKQTKSKDGLHSYCKPCDKEKSRQRSMAPEKASALRERDRLLASGLKECNACRIAKPFDRFYARKDRPTGVGIGSRCKDCEMAATRARQPQTEAQRALQRESYARNAEKRRAERRDKYWSDPERYNAESRAYREANKAKLLAYCRDWHNANKERANAASRAHYKANKSRYIEGNAIRKKARIAADPVFALAERVRSLIYIRLRSGGYTKRSRSTEILGCDWDFFKSHIERQFTKGMTWENRSEWHIDHIVPLASAKTEEDVIRLNHFTNLRPLWAKDNIAKSDRITHLV